MSRVHYLTRCTRIGNLELIEKSILKNKPKHLLFEWHIIFDIEYFGSIPGDVLYYYGNKYTLHFKDNKGYGMSVFNDIIPKVYKDRRDWFYILDDDNIIHQDFYSKIHQYLKKPGINGVLFSQYVGGKDWTGKEIRYIDENNIKVREVDSAQFLITYDLWEKSDKFGGGYLADGMFIEETYNKYSADFIILNDVLCFYNYIEEKDNPSNKKLPNYVVISDDVTYSRVEHEDYQGAGVNLIYFNNDNNIHEIINKESPDVIVTVSDDWSTHSNLVHLPLHIRKKWINIPKSTDKSTLLDNCFNAHMHSIIDKRFTRPLFSIFTPCYNTKGKLYRTYESIVNQTYDNWEWIIINDSDDENKTQKIIDDISNKDPRVKSYRFTKNSRGNIGFVKYTACFMSSGEFLVELDHDDEIIPTCLETIWEASKKYPECGFFYSDCCEALEDLRTHKYPDGWAWGYGSYYNEVFRGVNLNVANTPNINPKTIRAITSSPNHVRCWTRDTYFTIGGHNKDLPVADDYELMVRTFLNTHMCKINKFLYVQYFYDGERTNTTNYRRMDIARRVDFISRHYNEDIKNRFEEFGVEDWAYRGNPDNPLSTKSMFGNNEFFVNKIY